MLIQLILFLSLLTNSLFSLLFLTIACFFSWINSFLMIIHINNKAWSDRLCKFSVIVWLFVRHSSYWGQKSTRWTWRCADSWNNLGFSLYTAPSIYHMVTISENRKKSEMGVSTNLVCRHWTPEIKLNKMLSLLIIRLVNYSVTTSLIYKFLL